MRTRKNKKTKKKKLINNREMYIDREVFRPKGEHVVQGDDLKLHNLSRTVLLMDKKFL